MTKTRFVLAAIASASLLACSSVPRAERNPASPDFKEAKALYSAIGIAPVNGGYENFVGAGLADDGLTIAFSGGNHGSGDLGATFPWAAEKDGHLIGLGFNDMMVRLGDRVFAFENVWTKNSISDVVPKTLNVTRDADGSIVKLSMAVTGRELTSPDLTPLQINFELNLTQGRHVVVRREAFKRFDSLAAIRDAVGDHGGPIDDFINLMDRHGLAIPGLELTESALTLDPARKSFVSITSPKEKLQVTLQSFFGALERSKIDIIAAKKAALRLHMQYDYLALFPLEPARCGGKALIAYISGLLNRNDGKLQTLLDRDFLRHYGSSAFFFDAQGNDAPIKDIERYGQIRDTDDVARIGELQLTDVTEFPGTLHEVGPGTFNRRLIQAKRADGCVFHGFLENQARIAR